MSTEAPPSPREYRTGSDPRTLRDALPILRRAAHVMRVEFVEGETPTDEPATSLRLARDWLGGVTRHVLREMSLPVLMSR